jgi:hypothetical protein
MSSIDCETILLYNDYLLVGLVKLLVIDKIQKIKDLYLKTLLKDNIMQTCSYENRSKIVEQCYYIIKYMSIENGKKRVSALNKKLLKQSDNEYSKHAYIILNDVMEFHFKPRGLYTKAAL